MCLQCADIFFLKADICQLGMDQRKVHPSLIHSQGAAFQLPSCFLHSFFTYKLMYDPQNHNVWQKHAKMKKKTQQNVLMDNGENIGHRLRTQI